QHEVTGRPLDETFEPGAASFTRALAHATADHAEELDPLIGRHAHGWTIDRIAPLERAILRIALLEMLHPDVIEGDRPIPAARAGDRRPGGGDALAAALRRQAHPPGARARHRLRDRPGAARRARARRRARADPHLLADPRRPAGDGRRRPAPRPPDLPRPVRH